MRLGVEGVAGGVTFGWAELCPKPFGGGGSTWEFISLQTAMRWIWDALGWSREPTRPLPWQIVVLWSCEKPPPPSGKWPQSSVPLTIVQGSGKVRGARSGARAGIGAAAPRHRPVLPVPTAQPALLPLRGHPDGRGAEPGRGHQPVHQRGDPAAPGPSDARLGCPRVPVSCRDSVIPSRRSPRR